MDDFLAESLVKIRSEFNNIYRGNSPTHEILPQSSSEFFPIDANDLTFLHKFAKNNPIYFNSFKLEILGMPCIVYEGDINEFWINSIKHDTCYQPFYPTWLLSAYLLSLECKKLGYQQVVDIGSGDGRIAYCSQVLGISSHGIEIDENLVLLQEKISQATGVKFDIKKADATRFDYFSLGLSHPAVFIGGLPEMGEMIANSVVNKIEEIDNLKNDTAFVFTGTHSFRKFSKDTTKWGWGQLLDGFGLKVIKALTLPTHWTNDQPLDTPYVFTSTS